MMTDNREQQCVQTNQDTRYLLQIQATGVVKNYLSLIELIRDKRDNITDVMISTGCVKTFTAGKIGLGNSCQKRSSDSRYWVMDKLLPKLIGKRHGLVGDEFIFQRNCQRFYTHDAHKRFCRKRCKAMDDYIGENFAINTTLLANLKWHFLRRIVLLPQSRYMLQYTQHQKLPFA